MLRREKITRILYPELETRCVEFFMNADTLTYWIHVSVGKLDFHVFGPTRELCIENAIEQYLIEAEQRDPSLLRHPSI